MASATPLVPSDGASPLLSTGTRWAIRLKPEDDVVVATRPVEAGTPLERAGFEGSEEFTGWKTRTKIGLGHKVAIRDLETGAPVRKYGQIIGFASQPIQVGDWVHVHNLRADRFERPVEHSPQAGRAGSWRPEPMEPRTFQGYPRGDGRVGTRNYLAVISTVNCSAATSRFVAERFREPSWRRLFPNLDGVFALTHQGGCGLPLNGRDHQTLARVLAGFARHPNVAGYVVIGLGCEVAQADHLIESQALRRATSVGGPADVLNAPPLVLTIQEQGGIEATVQAGVEAVRRLMPAANQHVRRQTPASKLCVALECGGSDGASGLTANPALGVAADLVVGQGGTVILGETTEIYGAEHLLIERAVTPEVAAKLADRIAWWEDYVARFGATIDNNPSPGNKAGGLTTIYEKSLGALAKAGSSPLCDVVEYGQAPTCPGLIFMDTPGYDPVCTTGLVAGGANVLVFTTGRGSVLGLRPTPCLKVATNTPMYRRMIDDMDLDAGVILDGVPVDQVGRAIFEAILRVASGEPTKSDRLGVGEDEFVPWTIGPTL
ncbi:Galactarate dehydratase [Isosphaera pallida ATCC 43644]|uniref:Galactarate dehydratase n=1 Tax=Isosphaera pallida (strain ATCC 43644 / DSM 9630 / IS1B) TaxID=575540 RepID=E8QXE1_ISOPI|nr:altronate dehydratase family protein [Isosphaera pallida]ADV61982.1 Galactarate dehydratase [Isosphaera pallida ATCC 43644]